MNAKEPDSLTSDDVVDFLRQAGMFRMAAKVSELANDSARRWSQRMEFARRERELMERIWKHEGRPDNRPADFRPPAEASD